MLMKGLSGKLLETLRKGWFGASARTMRPMYSRALKIAWPAALEGLLISVISAADTMMVGTIGPAAIAAVGLTLQPRMILLVPLQSLTIGTTALIARRKGASNEQGIKACLNQSVYIGLAMGILVSLVGFFLAEPLMLLAGANAESLRMSVDYFRIISLGFVFNSLQLSICAAFRGLGRTRITLLTNLLSNILNLIFNYLLIGGNLGFPRLGVKGAAIATVIGTMAAGLLALFFASKGNSPFQYRFRRPRFDRDTLSGLFKIGSSSLAEAGFLRLGFMMTSRIIASLGTIAFAAFHIVTQVSMLSFTLCDGVAAAGVTMVGQSLGEGDKIKARRAVTVTRHISVVVSLFLMALIFALRRVLAQMFTNDEAVILAASAGFLVIIPALLPQNGRVVYAGCLRGAGDVRYVAMVALISVAILRPVMTWLFCFPLNAALPWLMLTATGPWFAFLVDALMRSALLSRRVRSDAWTNVVLR